MNTYLHIKFIFSFTRTSNQLKCITLFTLNGAEYVSLFVGEASDTACLVLETGLPPLLDVSHVPQVPDQDPPPGSPHHQPVPTHRHRVHLQCI